MGPPVELSVCCAGMSIVGLPAILVLLTTLVPDYVERARAVMQDRPWRSFLLGLVNFLFFGALAASVAWLIDINFVLGTIPGALSILIMLPLLLAAGLLASAGVVGERLWAHIASQSGRMISLLRSLAVGIVIMGLMLLIPLFGWILFLGLVTSGLGAAIMALFHRKQPQADPPLPPVVEPED